MENFKDSNMNTTMKSGEFDRLWERRKRWEDEVGNKVPDDATLLRMAELAHMQPQQNATIDLPNNHRRRMRWVPYAAAASFIAAVSIIGLTQKSNTATQLQLPIAKEVKIGEGQTVRFLCNNGCSAQEVLLASKDVINN